MPYQIVRTTITHQETETVFSIHAYARTHGIAILGEARGPKLRDELQGQPKLAGLHGPCWGGTDRFGQPIIRYEDAATYAALSA